MKTLIQNELYKLFSQKSVYIILLFISGLFILLNLQYIFSGHPYQYIDFNPIYKKIAGELTTEKLKTIDSLEDKSLDRSKKNAEQESQRINNLSTKLNQLLDPSTIAYINSYKDTNARAYIYQSLSSDLEFAKDRYGNYAEHYAKLKGDVSKSSTLTSYEYLRAKKELDMFSQTSKPSIYLNHAWDSLIDFNFTVGVLFIALMVMFGVAGIFSKEYASGMIAIIHSTVNGRKTLYAAKMISTFVYIAFIWLYVNILGFVVLTITFGWVQGNPNLTDMIKFLYTPFHWTVVEYYFYQLLISFIGAVSLGFLTACLSSRTHSNLLAFIATGIVFATPIVISRFMGPSVMDHFNYYDTMSLENLVKKNVFSNFFGTPVLSLNINICVLFGILVLSLLIAYRFYNTWQVRQ